MYSPKNILKKYSDHCNNLFSSDINYKIEYLSDNNDQTYSILTNSNNTFWVEYKILFSYDTINNTIFWSHFMFLIPTNIIIDLQHLFSTFKNSPFHDIFEKNKIVSLDHLTLFCMFIVPILNAKGFVFDNYHNDFKICLIITNIVRS